MPCPTGRRLTHINFPGLVDRDTLVSSRYSDLRSCPSLKQTLTIITHRFCTNLRQTTQIVSMIFEIHHQGGRWLVRRGNQHYGEYLNAEQAHLDAMEAASDARETGQDAEVWDRSINARIV